MSRSSVNKLTLKVETKRDQWFVFEEMSFKSLHNIILSTPELGTENHLMGISMVATVMITLKAIHIHIGRYI